jgi:hypothetical protein
VEEALAEFAKTVASAVKSWTEKKVTHGRDSTNKKKKKKHDKQ